MRRLDRRGIALGVTVLSLVGIAVLLVLRRAPPPAPAAGALGERVAGAPAPQTSASVEANCSADHAPRAPLANAPLLLAVRDARSGAPIVGARIELLSRRRESLGVQVSDAAGQATIVRPAGWGGGVLVTHAEYRPCALRDVEGEREARLEPLDVLDVTVSGLPVHLVEHTEVFAALDFPRLRAMPGSSEMLSAYRLYRDSGLAQRVAIDDGKARVPRAFAMAGLVEIFAAHAPSGWQKRLGRRGVAASDAAVAIEAGVGVGARKSGAPSRVGA